MTKMYTFDATNKFAGGDTERYFKHTDMQKVLRSRNELLRQCDRYDVGPIYEIDVPPLCYMPLGGGYSYANLRHGLSVTNRAGVEIYVQMGDDEAAMREIFDALDEVSTDADDPARARVAEIVLCEYFI